MHPLEPGTARWRVLAALGARADDARGYATAPALAIDAGLSLETTVRALGALRTDQLAEVSAWAALDTLHRVTDAGRERLAQGGQLALL